MQNFAINNRQLCALKMSLHADRFRVTATDRQTATFVVVKPIKPEISAALERSFHFRDKPSFTSSSGLSANENQPQQRNLPTGEHHSEAHMFGHETHDYNLKQ